MFKKEQKLLDVCCGTADWTLAMAEAVGETGEAVGLDFSQNMLKIGEEKVKNSPFFKYYLTTLGNAMETSF